MQVDSSIRTGESRGVAHKALCVLMALVLALGLMPMPRQQAWAAAGGSLAPASLDGDAIELAAGTHQGTGKTSFEVTEARQSAPLHAQIQNLTLDDVNYVNGGFDMHKSTFTKEMCDNFEVKWYAGETASGDSLKEEQLDWNSMTSKPTWGTDFTYTPDIYTAKDGTYKFCAVATYDGVTSAPLVFTVTVNRDGSGGGDSDTTYALSSALNPADATGAVAFVDSWGAALSSNVAKADDEVYVKVSTTDKATYPISGITVSDGTEATDVTESEFDTDYDTYSDKVKYYKFTMPAQAVTVTANFGTSTPTEKTVDVKFEVRDKDNTYLWEDDDYKVAVVDSKGANATSTYDQDKWATVFTLTVGETYTYTLTPAYGKESTYAVTTGTLTVAADQGTTISATMNSAGSDEPTDDPMLTLVVEPTEAAQYVQLWDSDTQLTVANGKVSIPAGTEVEVAFQTAGTPYTPESVEVTGTTINTYGGSGYWFDMPSSDATCTVKLSGGDTPEPSGYAINLATPQNGTVAFYNCLTGEQITTADENVKVGIKATPDEGYEVDSISVKMSGWDMHPADDATYDKVFTMGSGAVDVTVTFKETSGSGTEGDYTVSVVDKSSSFTTNGETEFNVETGSGKTLYMQAEPKIGDAWLTSGDQLAGLTLQWFQKGADGDEAIADAASVEWNPYTSDDNKTRYYYYTIRPEAPGDYVYYCKAVWTVDDEVVAEANGPEFTFHVADPVLYDLTKTVSEGGTAYFGSVSEDKMTQAKEGAEVEVWVSPSDGYEFDSVTAVDSKGNVLKTSKSYYYDNCWTFDMPADAVSVNVKFRTIPTRYAITGAMDDESHFWGTGVSFKAKGELDDSSKATEAAAGSIVTVYPVMGSGYKLAGVEVTAENGEPVEVKLGTNAENGGKYYFTMPASAVTVTVKSAEVTYQLVIGDMEHGTLEASVSEFAYPIDDDVTFTLTIKPDAGYKFDEGDSWTPGISFLDEDGSEIEQGSWYGLKYELSDDGTTATVTVNDYFSFNGETVTVVANFIEGDEQEIALTSGTQVSKVFGEATEFELGATCETAEQLSYASSNEEVATVDASGKVSIVGAGEATITVTAPAAPNYKEATAQVEVTVEEAENPFTISSKGLVTVPFGTDAVEASALYARSDDAVADDAKAEVVFLKKSGNKGIVVSPEDGSITLLPSLGVGSYPVRVLAITSGGQNMKAKTANVDFTVRVVQAESPLAITATDQTVTYSAAACDIAAGEALSLNMDGAAFVPTTSSDGIAVAADGKVTVPAGLAANKAYEVTVTAQSLESAGYAAGERTATLKVTVKPASIAGKALALDKASVTFNGSAQKPVVKTIGGKKYAAGDYTIEVKNTKGTVVKSPKDAGTYKVTVTGKGNYAGISKVATYTIKTAVNPFTVKVGKPSVSLAKVKKAKQTVPLKNSMTVKNNKSGGKVTYAKNAKKLKDAKLTISSAGIITVAKGAAKGKHTIYVDVTTAAKGNYAKTTKTVAVNVTVK